MRAHRLAGYPSLQLPYPQSIGRSKAPNGSVFYLEWFKQSLRDRNALSATMTPAVNIAEENRAGVNFELVERLAGAKRGTRPTLAGFLTSGRRSFEIRRMC